MSKLNHVLHLLAAFLSLGVAAALLIQAGLPRRAVYSGIRYGEPRTYAPEAGWLAPPFALLTTLSQTLALKDAAGTATIINFWATWCEPCRREMRELQALYEMYPDDLRILAVNVGENAAAARDWVEQLGLTYDVLLDSRRAVFARYKVRGLPTTFLLDKDHVIRRVYYGPIQLETLQRDIVRFNRKA
jgi:thiol-disulfide isomerase/thioredoxin